MLTGAWQWTKRLLSTLGAPRREATEHAQRILTIQRNIVIPARLLVMAAVLFQLHTSRW